MGGGGDRGGYKHGRENDRGLFSIDRSIDIVKVSGFFEFLRVRNNIIILSIKFMLICLDVLNSFEITSEVVKIINNLLPPTNIIMCNSFSRI